MRRSVTVTSAVLLSLSLGTTALLGQGATRLEGGVASALTGRPIAAAQIRVPDLGLVVESDAEGRFALDGVTAGTYVFVVSRIGFRPVSLEVEVIRRDDVDDVVDIGWIRIEEIGEALEELVVEGEPDERPVHLIRQGFYDRQLTGFGDFVTRAEIEDWNPSETTDILNRVPGLLVRPNRNYGLPLPLERTTFGYVAPSPSNFSRQGRVDTRRYVISSRRSTAAGCAPVIYLDNVLMGDAVEVDIDELIGPSHIEAIEVYLSASAMPPRFAQRGARCGAIVVWTR